MKDGWWLILGPAYLVIAVLYLAPVVAVLYLIYRFTRSAIAVGVAAVVAGCAPAAWHLLDKVRIERALSSRKSLVAGLAHVPAPKPLPRTLVVVGEIPAVHRAVLISHYGFDRIFMLEPSRAYPFDFAAAGLSMYAKLSTRGSQSDCFGFTPKALTESRWALERRADKCIRTSEMRIVQSDLGGDAIVVAFRSPTPLKLGRSSDFQVSEVVEVRSRSGSRDELVAYHEVLAPRESSMCPDFIASCRAKPPEPFDSLRFVMETLAPSG